MRILVFGVNGQVGQEFCGLDTNHEIIPVARAQADLSLSGVAKQIIAREKPDCVINAAAYTAVDKAEQEKDLAIKINAHAVADMAAATKNIDARFIHISTDYVFDGAKSDPYTESDLVNPLSVYGRTKYGGEFSALDEIRNR